jgi:hypothetical protein
MQLTCPCCFAAFPVEAALESAAGRELMGVLAQAGPLARPLAAYLGCFRSASRALAWERALRLAREVMDLTGDQRALATALGQTVEALRTKRERGDSRPLKNNNYLKQVLESVAATDQPVRSDLTDRSDQATPAAKGKRRQAIELLAAWAGDDWLRIEIAHGLSALTALPHLAPPGADAVEMTAGVYETVIRRRVNIFEVDRGRVTEAFGELLKTSLKEWPEPSAVIGHLPRRPERHKLTADLSADDRAAAQHAMAAIRAKL